MKRRMALAVLALGAAAFLAAGGVGIFVVLFEGPGGMRPTYDAADHDARLTRVARTAIVVIQALGRYRRDHAAFPDEAADLAAYLPPGSTSPGNPMILGWHYHRGGHGYMLTRKLGWDPDLRYELDGSGARWVFVPGDGSPEKPILLRP